MLSAGQISPPPEVVLIERQPRRWANRKMLSGPRAEPTNQAGRESRPDVCGERSRFFYREAGSHPGGGAESCRLQGCSGDGFGQIGPGLASEAGALATELLL